MTGSQAPRRRGRDRPGYLPRDHPTASMFLDETGAIAKDRFFGVGMIKCEEASRMLRAVQKLRDQRHWYKEFKFSELTSGTLPLYRDLVDVVLGSSGRINFFCFVADRTVADPIDRFSDAWTAYAKMAEQLVTAGLRAKEIVSVMADNYSTPDTVLFEEDLRASVNRRRGRLAVASVVRLDSRSSDGLQVVDLFTSAAAFEFRAHAGIASPTSPKAELSKYVRERMGAVTLLGGWRNDDHSVQVYDHGRWQAEQAVAEVAEQEPTV